MPKFMNVTKVITGVNTRWSYANVWDPKSINGGAPKYSVSLIQPLRLLPLFLVCNHDLLIMA